MYTADYFISSFLIALAAVLFVFVLSEPGEIFGWLRRILFNLFDNDTRINRGEDLHPVYKMTIGCEKCVAGQWAFWSMLIINWRAYLVSWKFFIPHLLFVALTISLAMIIAKLYNKYLK